MTEWILSSSVLILVVIGLRTVLKGKITLRLQYALWALVLLRLLIPVNFGSSAMSVSNLTAAEEVTVTADSIQEFPQLNLVPNQPQESNTHIHQDQARPGKVDSAEKQQTTQKVDWIDAARITWFAGMILVGTAFCVTNLHFRKKIMASRKPMNIYKDGLTVYVSDRIDTPCLFGLLKPAIYITYPVADDETLLRHTLVHEATHFRHRDHVWSVLRCVCLALHWYNPLVWWAAFLSRQDAELACDEATITKLGEGERAEYGRTLIGMTCQKKANVLIAATTMNSGKSGLKERIMLIARKPKMAVYTLAAVVLIAAISVGCTFTGAKTSDNGSGARGEVLDSNGEILLSKDLENETTPNETIETTQTPTEMPDDAPPVGLPDTLHEQPDPDKICIGVQPTALSKSSYDLYYIIPENQEILLEYYLAAEARATELSWDNNVKMTGWYICYQGKEWQVFEDGSLRGEMTIAGEDAKELYAFCQDAIREAGIGEPVRPEDITGIISATLYWNGDQAITDPGLLKGAYTVTDPIVLDRLETLFANSSYYGSVRCPFAAHLELILENGDTILLAMSTDSCASWMSQGVAYGYGVQTNVGIEGNEEFYSFFLADIIHEKAKEGPEAVAKYWPYVNWGLYSRKYSIDDTFALMDMFKAYVLENPTDWMICVALSTPRGLDGAFAQYYANVIGEIFEAAPATFHFACRQMVPEQYVEDAVNFLAFYWDITPEEARVKLEAAQTP